MSYICDTFSVRVHKILFSDRLSRVKIWRCKKHKQTIRKTINHFSKTIFYGKNDINTPDVSVPSITDVDGLKKHLTPIHEGELGTVLRENNNMVTESTDIHKTDSMQQTEQNKSDVNIVRRVLETVFKNRREVKITLKNVLKNKFPDLKLKEEDQEIIIDNYFSFLEEKTVFLQSKSNEHKKDFSSWLTNIFTNQYFQNIIFVSGLISHERYITSCFYEKAIRRFSTTHERGGIAEKKGIYIIKEAKIAMDPGDLVSELYIWLCDKGNIHKFRFETDIFAWINFSFIKQKIGESHPYPRKKEEEDSLKPGKKPIFIPFDSLEYKIGDDDDSSAIGNISQKEESTLEVNIPDVVYDDDSENDIQEILLALEEEERNVFFEKVFEYMIKKKKESRIAKRFVEIMRIFIRITDEGVKTDMKKNEIKKKIYEEIREKLHIIQTSIGKNLERARKEFNKAAIQLWKNGHLSSL